MDQNAMKRAAAEAAFDHLRDRLDDSTVIGVGTGSTVDHFIDLLERHRRDFDGAVASSESTAEKLRAAGIPVFDLNGFAEIPFYVDGADEVSVREGYRFLLHLFPGRHKNAAHAHIADCAGAVP